MILVGVVLFLGLAEISCKHETEEFYLIYVVNESPNDLVVQANTFSDGVPAWKGNAPVTFLEPHGRGFIDYFLTKEEFEEIESSWVLKIIFMETVKSKADVNCRADTSNVRVITKFYTLPEVRAMDWTIVYDGSME